MSQPQQAETVYVTGAGAFFATMYFIQGIGDPTSGLIAQPVRALLKSWHESASTIGAFMGLLALPWMIKPLFALLSDYVPLAGSHRRNYLLLSSAAAAIGLLVVWLVPLPHGALGTLLLWLLLPTIGIAFGDVLVDALMVEVGQPRGLTGRLQSIQWGAVNLALLLAGVLGGWLSGHGRYDVAFGLCAALWALSLVLAWRYAHDTPRPAAEEGLRGTTRDLVAALSVPGLLTIAVFLFLWSFNPSWVSVQYLHITVALGLSEEAYGNSLAWFAAGAVVASLGYGVYCRIWPMGRLVHVAIVTGILGYLVFVHIPSANWLYAISFVSGAANMTGNLVQFDLAARLVPIHVAATWFAVLMALSNIASSASEALGAILYDSLGPLMGVDEAYRAIVLLSVLFAASCWLLVPRLKRQVPQWWSG